MWALVLVALGALVGVLLRVLLGRRGYRYPDEAHLPLRSLDWIPPVTVLLTFGIGGRLLPGRHPVVVFTVLAAIWMLVGLSAVDLDVHRIPDAVTLPAYPVTLVCLAASAWVTDDWPAFGRALIAGASLLVGYLLLSRLAPGRQVFGLGDVKLGGLLGLILGWFGWTAVAFGTYLAFLTGGIVALALLAGRQMQRGTPIAFGPFLSLGAVLGIALA